MSLRKKAIRLAYAKPALRPLLLPLLKKAYGANTPFWDRMEPGGLANPAPWEKAEQKKGPSTEDSFPGDSFVEFQGMLLAGLNKALKRVNFLYKVTLLDRDFDIRPTSKGYKVDALVHAVPKKGRKLVFPEEGLTNLAKALRKGVESVVLHSPLDISLRTTLDSRPGETPAFRIKGEIDLGIDMRGTRRHYPRG